MLSLARGRGAPFYIALTASILAFALTHPALAQRAGGVAPEIISRSSTLDVPFVPSHQDVVKTMLDLARPTNRDFLIDLGSGDGRIVITAARDFGLEGFGVDLNEALVDIAKERAVLAGVGERAKFYLRDLFETDIRDATILTMYLLPDVVLTIREKLLNDLRPGARIVSHDYHMGEWLPDEIRIVEIPERGFNSIVYYWVVPAKVGGIWEWTIDNRDMFYEAVAYRASLTQRFQDVEGEISLFPFDQRIRNARVEGTRIAFSVAGPVHDRVVIHEFEGEVSGDRITGTVRVSGGVPPATVPWSARRIRPAE